MHNQYVQKLNAIEKQRKLTISAVVLLVTFVFLYLLHFYSVRIESTQILKGKLISSKSNNSKSIFQSCTVELANKAVVLASCQATTPSGEDVNIMKTVYSNNNIHYSICSPCLTHSSSGTPNGAP